MKNISVKLFLISTSGSGQMSLKTFLFILNLSQWLRMKFHLKKK